MELRPDPYIPVGCLVVDTEPQTLAGGRADRWLWTRPCPEIPVSQAEALEAETANVYVPDAIADGLAHRLPEHALLKSAWVRLALRSVEGRAVVRVYVLPEDQLRHVVARDNAVLAQGLRVLMGMLDCGDGTWQARLAPQTPLEATRRDAAPPDTSLLHMFNTVPSPAPQPGLLDGDASYARVLDALARSRLPGLRTSTTLHDYQVRSATVMVQREVCPGRVVDPRLAAYRDRDGGTFYWDAIGGTVVRAAQFYDGVAGGILAEEMGTGKTLICLALVLATRTFPTQLPPMAVVVPHGTRTRADGVAVADAVADAGAPRPRGARSLLDMAAATVSRDSVPWKLYRQELHGHCVAAIERNPATYVLPPPHAVRSSRDTTPARPRVLTPSTCSLVIVPANLVRQWEHEMHKHADESLRLRVVDARRPALPSAAEVLQTDVLLFAMPAFERLVRHRVLRGGAYVLDLALAAVHYKRVIVDEGHRIGHARMSRKSNLLLLLDCLAISARWIVTGTPSTGLYGVDGVDGNVDGNVDTTDATTNTAELKDLERLGAMASLYLGMRPWANTEREAVLGGRTDSRADWAQYMTSDRACLRHTLDALIVRHRTADTRRLLPAVRETTVLLDPTAQETLSLNLFAMMIVFNAVQSQRTDQDYFFHPSQRGALLQLVTNMRQAAFFGAFFSVHDIRTAVDTAEAFLAEHRVPVSSDDERLLRDAIAFGRAAVASPLKTTAETYHEVPIAVTGLPGGDARAAWSVSLVSSVCASADPDTTVSVAPLVRGLQQLLRPCLDAPFSLQAMIDSGRFAHRGHELHAALQSPAPASTSPTNRPDRAGTDAAGAAGATADTAPAPPADASPLKNRTGMAPEAVLSALPDAPPASLVVCPELAGARLVATASAKLSYLLDAIARHQATEKMIVFYDNENTAFYLAEHLDILQVRHLIYAKGLSPERRAQYVASFNGQKAHNDQNGQNGQNGQKGGSSSRSEAPPTDFRVMLMDISQAAFGLDMWAASRMYFVSPVLNPQVEAQAIGRVRRISQTRPVTVKTLVLRGSIEELVVDRRASLTHAEHRGIRTLLDDGPLFRWVQQAHVRPPPNGHDMGRHNVQNMARLQQDHRLFGHGAGRVEHPDEGLVPVERTAPNKTPNKILASSHDSKPQLTRSGSDLGAPPVKMRRTMGVRFD